MSPRATAVVIFVILAGGNTAVEARAPARWAWPTLKASVASSVQTGKRAAIEKATALREAGTRLWRGAKHLARRTRGKATLMADRVEAQLSGRGRGAFVALRQVAAVPSYLKKKFKEDKVFLSGYGIATVTFSKIVPLLPAAGVVSVGTASALYLGNLVVDGLAVGGRVHHLRKKADPNTRLIDTARFLRKEFTNHAAHRRAVNRRYMRRWGGDAQQDRVPTHGDRVRDGGCHGACPEVAR